MKNPKKYKPSVTRNKIRRIKKALEHAGGSAREFLEERLKFWEGKL